MLSPVIIMLIIVAFPHYLIFLVMGNIPIISPVNATHNKRVRIVHSSTELHNPTLVSLRVLLP